MDSKDLDNAIQNALTSPKIVKGDEGEVEMPSLTELIKAAKYLKQQKQNPKDSTKGIFKKIVPPGSID